MKVLFLEALATVAGGQKVLLSWLADERRIEPQVIIPGKGEFSAQLERIGVAYHVVPMGDYTLVSKGWRDRLRFVAELPRLALSGASLIRRLDPDLIYANSSRTVVWGTLAAAITRTPIVWHIHNMVADRPTRVMVNLLARLRIVRSVVAVCGPACAQFPNVSEKCRVIYNGIDSNQFRPDRALGDASRQLLNIGENSFVVGIVGDITPHKGQATLLEAVHDIAGDLRIHVLIIGRTRENEPSATYLAELRHIAKELPKNVNVHFLGQRTDMCALYNAMDVLVVAATAAETTSLAMQEAMMCGRAVVASATGGIPELVENGVNGHLYEAGNPGALGGMLSRCGAAAQECAQMGARAREIGVQRFDLRAMRDRLYASLVAATEGE